MEFVFSFGWALAESSLTLTGLEPVVWGMTAVTGLCIALLGLDAFGGEHPAAAEHSVLTPRPVPVAADLDHAA